MQYLFQIVGVLNQYLVKKETARFSVLAGLWR